MSINVLLNEFLEGGRIPKHEFDDLKFVLGKIQNLGRDERDRILNWFRFLQKIEIVGWRPKAITLKVIKILLANSRRRKTCFYALFCPSYKKGKGVFGFRTDGVGVTTEAGIKNLVSIWAETKRLGFYCESSLAIFFDVAIEQPEKVIPSGGLKDLEINIKNLKAKLPRNVRFIRLSELNRKLFKKIGYSGVVSDPLPIPTDVFDRIVERGKKFYKLFGWTEARVIERSKIIATSEAMVGAYLKRHYPNGIMVYTPTMLERGAVYSGMEFTTNPLPIIFPKKEGS